MKTLEEIKKEFGELKRYIKDISVGQYNDKGVNIGFLDADEVIWQFIESTISQTKQELIEEAINSLTGDIRKYKFINDGLKKWRLSEDREDRGIEPCDECGNGGMIRDFLEKLSNK